MTDRGWDKLIEPLIIQCGVEGVKIHQIKEKFGGLRFYIGPNFSKRLYDMIDEAEKQSYHVCERCGKPGELRKDRSWLKTLCEECK